MINWIRSIIYVFWLYSLILILGVIWLPTLLMSRKAAMSGIRTWAALARFGLRWICGVRTEFRGLEHLPDGACLVASKHQSMYDTIAPFLFLRDPAFILKRELMFYPIFGWYAWRTAMIPIDRGGAVKSLKAMMARARKETARGRQVLIFPEGTRQLPGAKPDYKSGVYAMYKEVGVPCAPVALITGHCWPRKGMKRTPGKIIFEVLPPIEPNLPRKVFMARLQEAIEPASDRLLEEATAPPTPASLTESVTVS